MVILWAVSYREKHQTVFLARQRLLCYRANYLSGWI